MGNGGFGWGNNSAVQGALTRAELYDGLNSQNTFSEFRSIENSITNGFANNALALNNGFNSVNSNINDIGYRMADCCCQIKTAIHSEGETTRALIQSNTIQDLRDKVADKDREILATGLTTAQVIQTNTLENFIRDVLKTTTATTTTTA